MAEAATREGSEQASAPRGSVSAADHGFIHLSHPNQMVKLVVKTNSFLVHEEVLTKDSPYFLRALGTFVNADSPKKLEFHDIEGRLFASFVSLLYALFFNPRPDFKLSKDHLPNHRWIPNAVYLYTLADRFEHEPIKRQSKIALDDVLNFCEIGQWWHGTDEQKTTRICNYVEGYHACGDRVPFRDNIVNSFCRGCPWEVFKAKHDSLPSSFEQAVATRFAELAKRVEDGQPRKRLKSEP